MKFVISMCYIYKDLFPLWVQQSIFKLIHHKIVAHIKNINLINNTADGKTA